jgi:uncharacterized membrane protein
MEAAAASLAPLAGPRLKWRATPLQLAVLLTFLALAVRLSGISMRPLWLDEAYSAWFSSRSWHELWTVVPTYETHPPFYYSLLKLWRLGFGGSALSLRLPSVLLGAATVPIVMLAARQIERLRPSGRPLLLMGAAGFLAACGPTLVEHGQEARPYAPMSFAYSVAILGLLLLFGEFADGKPGSRRNWLILALGSELTLWSHALGAVYAACIAIALLPSWLTKPMPKQRITRGLITAATILLTYLPCLWLIAGRTRDWGSGWISWKPEMLLTLLSIYGVPVEVLTIGSAVAALILFLLAKRAIAAGLGQRGWSAERALLLLWWGVPLITALVSALFVPVFLPRTLTATLVPFYLAIGAALARTESSKERLALMAVLVATLFPATIAMALRPATEPWDQVDAYLQRNVRAGDIVWLYPNDSALPLRAAGPRSTYVRHGIPADYPALGVAAPRNAGSPAVPSVTPKSMEKLIGSPEAMRARTIWLVTSQAQYFDPKDDLGHALSAGRRPGPRQRWEYLRIQAFARP